MIRPASTLPERTALEDLVKGNDHIFEVGTEEKLGGEKGAGHLAGDGDLFSAQPLLPVLVAGRGGQTGAGIHDEHRTISVAHARAAWQERVLVEHVGQGMDRDRRDVEFPARRLRSLSVWISCRMCSKRYPRMSIWFSAIA